LDRVTFRAHRLAAQRRRQGDFPVHVSERVDCPLRLGRTYAGHELQEAEPCHLDARIVSETERRERVLDVCRFEVEQTAEPDEGNTSPGEFNVEVDAVMGRTEQHRLLLQGNALFIQFKGAVCDRFGLVSLVGAVDEQWLACPNNRSFFAQD